MNRKPSRGIVGYVVLLSTLLLIAILLNGGLNQTVSRRIEYPQLLEMIKEGKVARVAIRNNSLVGLTNTTTVTQGDFPERNYDFETTIGEDFLGTVRQIEANKNYSGIFTMFAWVLLTISPMIWVFSQILFYYKRRQEFDLYLAIGSTMSALRKLMLQDAIRYASISAGLFLLLAPPVSLMVHRAIGFVTALLGGDMLASFQLPWLAYLAGALISAACGFVSTMIPWFTYQKQDTPLRKGASENLPKEETVHE